MGTEDFPIARVGGNLDRLNGNKHLRPQPVSSEFFPNLYLDFVRSRELCPLNKYGIFGRDNSRIHSSKLIRKRL